MVIKDNFSIFNLFLDKKVKLTTQEGFFYIRIPTIKEFCLEEKINAVFHIWTLPEEQRQKLIPVEVQSSFELLTTILFQLAIYKEYSVIAQQFKEALQFFIPKIEINNKEKQLVINNVILTTEIWDYILYILKLSCGEKVEKPRTFNSEEERQFYLAQKKMEEKIKKIKAQKPGDSDSLLKSFLTIQYKFNLSFDYLAEQTLAQIQWLQGYAAGAVSYEVNAQAFAAGNMKKGKKLDFFIK